MAHLTQSNGVLNWFNYQLKERKLNDPFGWILMMIWGLLIAYVTIEVNYKLTAVLVCSVIGIFVLLVCLRYPLIGVYCTIIFSSLYSLPGRMFNMPSPIGILVEAFTYILLIAVLGTQVKRKEKAGSFWRSPITITYTLIIIYYIIEIANPSMLSLQGWVFFFRKQISYFLFYYICYVLLDSLNVIKVFIKFWIILTLIIAAYGVKQQWFGLFNFEKLWLWTDPEIMQLFFQGGFLRKFSFLTDPAAFGVVCACFALFTLVLAIRITNKKAKYFLFFSTIISLLGSAYSGSRTCNLMIVAGLFAYAVFTLNEKRTYFFIIGSVIVGLFLLYGPYQNQPVIFRIKTTFQGTKDPSALLRDYNRSMIQPYIHDHPIGGGLNTSGAEGWVYNDGHILSHFRPDSGYMKILLEQGWIGFAIQLLLYFLILKKGLDGFYKARNIYIKNLYIALTVCLFALIVGQYSQVAIAQYPLTLFYFSSIAILQKLILYDTSTKMEADET